MSGQTRPGSRRNDRLTLRPYRGEDLDAAAGLLSDRHREHRTHEPALAVRFEDFENARAELDEITNTDGAIGAVAYRRDELVGYLVGVPRDGATWGPAIWVGASGHATRDPDVVRDLYGAASQQWVDSGRTAHYALVPSFDRDVLESWYSLGFGQQHAHAVRDVPAASAGDAPTSLESPPGVVIRPAQLADIRRLAELDLVLPAHQAQAPTFSAEQVPSLEETIEEWHETLGGDDFAVFVAEVDGRVAGSAVACDLSQSTGHSGLAAVDDAGLLAFAAVDPDARGRGAGRALGEAVLDWSARQRYRHVVTDWRTTNLLSSRTWTGLGYRPTFYRLHRLLGY